MMPDALAPMTKIAIVTDLSPADLALRDIQEVLTGSGYHRSVNQSQDHIREFLRTLREAKGNEERQYGKFDIVLAAMDD